MYAYVPVCVYVTAFVFVNNKRQKLTLTPSSSTPPPDTGNILI